MESLSANDAVKLLIHFTNENNKGEFYRVANEYLQSLSFNGRNWGQIKSVLNRRPMEMLTLDQLPKNIKALISTQEQSEEFVYLNPSIESMIDDIIFEWKNKDVYKSHNLGIRNKILLHGLTGNGKTTIARNIAKVSKMPFVEVRSEMIIDSKLGSTGQNISSLLNSIKEPCILFWDEIDTIGKKRSSVSDNSASHENDRMVNTILVSLDKMANDVIFIGATNRLDVLDDAFLRRFDIKFEVGNPTHKEKEMFLDGLFKYYNVPKSEINLTSLVNFSEIKDKVIQICRNYVINLIKKNIH